MQARQRSSFEQLSVLIQFMESHGDLSKPRPGPQGRINSEQLWLELTNILNSMGGGVQKTADKWKKVWTDWKTKTKKKYLHIRQQSSGTGGGPNTHIQLTAIEERVMAVIGVSAVVGLAGIQEQGFNVPNFNEQPPEPMHFAEMLENQSSQNTDPIFDGRTSPLPLPSLLSPQRPPEPLQPPLPQQPPQQRLSQPPTPPARNGRRQPSASPRSTMSANRFARRTKRRMTPFERAAEQFSAVERRRLTFEEERDRRLHEREMERLRLEAEKIKIAERQTAILEGLRVLGERLIGVLSEQRPANL
ncbi:uncharacterized protein LOC111353696 [Spodoptera litura]|uniref:Regulatory protein zeste n=1 Tax=Spodoptera litura TaxID=69820 RepID=A0A9J7E1J4_SPOLT|nr:uncharacterized protein LOC111353696 [Spodoptera litura]